MTDYEKIKELAEQYAQEMYAASGRNPFTENIQSEIDNALSVMQWLSETHCIVPKTTLDKHYTEMAKDYAMYLDPDNKANREMIEVDSLGFLNWVMAKYCIVEKRKF